MRPQDGPITRQIVEVVHDDGNKQVDDLSERKKFGQVLVQMEECSRNVMGTSWECSGSHQESTQHEEADEVNDGEVASAAELLSWFVVRLRIAAFPWKAGQHDLLPRFTCGTPVHTHTHPHTGKPAETGH